MVLSWQYILAPKKTRAGCTSTPVYLYRTAMCVADMLEGKQAFKVALGQWGQCPLATYLKT